VLDLNSLHAINCMYGHAVGNTVLTEIAHRIQRIAGHSPVWRAGGQYVIATRISGVDELRRLASDLRSAIEEPVGGASFGVGMGAALASPGSTRASELWRNADEAMWRAKRRRTREVVIAPEE
jgi:diguanylate cyclase (GGDEF)-like protein